MKIGNETPFEAEALPFLDLEGKAFLTVIVKGTFTIVPEGVAAVAEAQIPILFGDEPGGPGKGRRPQVRGGHGSVQAPGRYPPGRQGARAGREAGPMAGRGPPRRDAAKGRSRVRGPCMDLRRREVVGPGVHRTGTVHGDAPGLREGVRGDRHGVRRILRGEPGRMRLLHPEVPEEHRRGAASEHRGRLPADPFLDRSSRAGGIRPHRERMGSPGSVPGNVRRVVEERTIPPSSERLPVRLLQRRPARLFRSRGISGATRRSSC